jgi:hypothetical protein
MFQPKTLKMKRGFATNIINKKAALLLSLLVSSASLLNAQAPSVISFTPTSGGAYAFITIKGNNFTGATAISFGGTPANFFFVQAPGIIVASVGTGASGAVKVTTPGGTDSLPGFTFIPPPVVNSITPSAGDSGAVITIKGANFTGTSYVSFGGIGASSFKEVSDSVIKATVSTGASGYVTVGTSWGIGSIGGFNFTGPTILSFTPTAGTAGTAITIKGTNFTGASAVSFGGTPATSFTVTSATTITAIVSAGSAGNVVVTTPHGTARLAGFIEPFISSFNPADAGPGAVVVIKGHNFTSASAVAFGGIQAKSFTVLSDTAISAVVGKGASGSINVTTGSGTAYLSGFNYLAPPPTIISFSPGSGGAGTAVTIKGTNFLPFSSVFFGYNLAKSVTVSTDSTITAIVGNGVTGQIQVSTRGGSAFSSAIFTFTGPQITAFAPNSGWQGDTINIEGTNLQNVTAISFGDVPASYFVIKSPTLVRAVVAGGASDNITLTATDGTAYTGPFVFNPQPPVITSFSPPSGPVGTTITVSGNNFNETAVKNIVYFGSTRALVLSASSTQVKMVAPTGSTYQPFSITDSATGLTANAKIPFQITFPGDTAFTNSSFSSKIELFIDPLQGKFGAINVKTSDLDGDGKPEIIAQSNVFEELTVFKNMSTPGKIIFDGGTNFFTGSNSGSVAITDFDGDGKPDIALTSGGGGSSEIRFYRNTSTSGYISFADPVYYFHHGYNPDGDIVASDFDGDGKPDIAEAHGNAATSISVYRNLSTPGKIMFGTNTDYETGDLPYGLAAGDIDGDNKPEIVVANSSGNTVSILANKCSLGKISFVKVSDLPIGDVAFSVLLGDMDGDKKLDILTANSNSNGVSIYRNTSKVGSVSFAKRKDYSTGPTPYGFAIDDLNGDSKPDIAIPSNDKNTFLLLKNNSSAGKIDFTSPQSYTTGNQPKDITTCDLDGDGLPDVITVNWLSNSCSVFRNQMNDGALPVHFIDFTVQQIHKGNLLQWQTASEINSSYFNAQRSQDGQHFTTIGKVAAAGTSNVVQNYQFVDGLAGLNNTPAVIYYRVQEADKDGAFTYSKIVAITSRPQAGILAVYPNPVRSLLTIQVQGITGTSIVRITDVLGKTLQAQQVNVVNGQTITFNTQRLAAGVYFVHLQQNGHSFVEKFLKE